MFRKLFILLAFVVVATPALAQTTYYISPNGTDCAYPTCGTSSNPYRTFNYALDYTRFNGTISTWGDYGDSLILKDGEYTTAVNGNLLANCNANTWTASAARPVIIQAENERQAWVHSNGTSTAAKVVACSYWQFIGLRVSNTDNVNLTDQGYVFQAINSDHLLVKRGVFHNNNRYENSHLIALENTHDSLIEENEGYYFHRHGFIAQTGSQRNVWRRNYLNSRDHADLPGATLGPDPGTPKISNYTERGDDAISIYPGSNNLVENNISEGNAIAGQAISQPVSSNNQFFGNISLNDYYGYGLTPHSNVGGYGADNLHKDAVVINPNGSPYGDSMCFFGGHGPNMTFTNGSCFTGAGTKFGVQGTQNDQGSSQLYTMFVTNFFVYPSIPVVAASDPPGCNRLLRIAAGGCSPYSEGSFVFDGTDVLGSTDLDDFQCSYCAADSATFNPTLVEADADYNNEFTNTPTNLGTCYAWIPATSNLKGAGSGGGDIGASILYRYQGGVLTTTKLWDPSTGEFPHGAIVAGLNDVAGESAFDVHTRLNINTNGCDFPAGYGTSGGGGSGVSFIADADIEGTYRVNTTLDKPTTTTTDDVMVALLYSYLQDVSPPSGWTLLTGFPENTGSDPFRCYAWWKRATASEPSTYQFDHANAFTEAWIGTFRGAVTSGSIEDTTPTKNEVLVNATITATGLTVATDGARLLWAYFAYDGPNDGTPPTGYTEQYDGRVLNTATKAIVSSTGATGDVVGTNGNTFDYLATLIAIRPETETEPEDGTITFSAPWTGLKFKVGDTLIIGFEVFNITGNIVLQFSPNGGTTWRTVSTAVPSAAGTYTFNTTTSPPNVPAATEMKLRLCQDVSCAVQTESGAFEMLGSLL